MSVVGEGSRKSSEISPSSSFSALLVLLSHNIAGVRKIFVVLLIVLLEEGAEGDKGSL